MEIRGHTLSIPAEEFAAVKRLPADWTAIFIRNEALCLIDAADNYVMNAAPDLVGLAVDKHGVPFEVTDDNRADAALRKATDEPEVMPISPEFNAVRWNPAHP